MEIPAPQAGKITELRVAVGDTVSEGSVLAADRRATARRRRRTGRAGEPRVEETAARSPRRQSRRPPSRRPRPPAAAEFEKGDVHAQVLVLGSGPGGYTAAFRAADLGTRGRDGRALRDARRRLPQRRLHPVQGAAAHRQGDRRGRDGGAHGVCVRQARDRPRQAARVEGRASSASSPAGSRAWRRCARSGRAPARARFTGAEHADGDRRGRATTTVSFDNAIVAAGSRSVELPGFPPRRPARDVARPARSSSPTSRRGCSSSAAASSAWRWRRCTTRSAPKVTVVELLDGLIPGADRDLVKPLQKRIERRYEAIHLEHQGRVDRGRRTTACTRRSRATSPDARVRPRARRRRPRAERRGPRARRRRRHRRRARLHPGRRPAAHERRRTSTRSATSSGSRCSRTRRLAEAHVAAEVIAGHDVVFDARGIPNVAYTDPEVAWVGLTETEAKENGIAVREAGVPVVGERPRAAVDGAAGIDQAALRPGDQARARRRHRRHRTPAT